MKGSALPWLIGGVAAAAVGVGAYFLLKGPKTSCPSGDVAANSDGSCPSGYVADPAAPGCCKPSTSTGGVLIFEVSGNSGSIALNCAECATISGEVNDDLVLQCAGATPGGQVAFFLSATGVGAGDWNPLQNPVSLAAEVVTADEFGNVTLPWASCYLQAVGPGPSWSGDESYGPCPGAATQPALVYMVAQDVTTGEYSDVISITGVGTLLANCRVCT